MIHGTKPGNRKMSRGYKKLAGKEKFRCEGVHTQEPWTGEDPKKVEKARGTHGWENLEGKRRGSLGGTIIKKK